MALVVACAVVGLYMNHMTVLTRVRALLSINSLVSPLFIAPPHAPRRPPAAPVVGLPCASAFPRAQT